MRSRADPWIVYWHMAGAQQMVGTSVVIVIVEPINQYLYIRCIMGS